MKAWEIFLTQLEEELGKNVVTRWLRPLRVVRFDAANLYLEAKDYFQALWFEEHIRPKAEACLTNNNLRKITIHLTIANHSLPKNGQSGRQPNKKPDEAKPFRLSFDPLDPRHTLESYYCHQDNFIAMKLLSNVIDIQSPQPQDFSAFNPLYLFGPEGTGKSHLLVAIAKKLKEKNIPAIYVKADTFTQHVIDAIRAGEMSAFRQIYRNIDVLLMDDVHLLARKGATQEELFHTFNTLHLAGKQMIFSANSAPQELQLIEPRLISRFEWGISLPLKSLNPEDLRTLLDRKTEILQFPLIAKIKEFLIETFSANTKAVLSALDALILRAHLHNQSPNFSSTTMTLTNAKHYLSDLIQGAEKYATTPEKIIQTVAEHYSIPQEEILGKSQSRDCVYFRQVAMFLCRLKLKMPFAKIGELFDRDHSTVMTSVKRIQTDMEANEQELINTLHVLEQKLH